jgi:tetratricopeptide (TPR) repeat protein
MNQLPGTSDQNKRGDQPTIFFEGKVVTESGTALWDANVVLQCGYTSREVATGVNGLFDLQMNVNESAPAACDLSVDAPMYAEQRLTVRLGPSYGIVPIGTIVLHPMNNSGVEENSTISVVSLAAPSTAKKAYEKGLHEKSKGKLARACDYFRKAVELYPRYAIAWLELGRAQALEHNMLEAQHSFEEAQRQDSHLLPAYVELTQLTAKQNQWIALAKVTDHALQVSTPESAPWFYFFNSFAKANLGNVTGAEQAVNLGLRADVRHTVPNLEYLCGLILARQHNYSEAIEHIRTYLRLAPNASDAQVAQKKLSELEGIVDAK